MKQPLDVTALIVDSFDVTQVPGFTPGLEPLAGLGEERSHYCTYFATCVSCFTDCPCA